MALEPKSAASKSAHSINFTTFYHIFYITNPYIRGLCGRNRLRICRTLFGTLTYLPTKGMSQLLQTVNRVRRGLNPHLRIDGALLTMVDNRTNFAKDVSAALREGYAGKLKVFKAEIPLAIRAAEAAATGNSIFIHDAGGKAAAAYENLTKEVQEHAKERARNDQCR